MPEKISDNNHLGRYEKLRISLKELVYDQNDAIDEVVDALIHMTFKPPVAAQPKAIFTFLGPPSVGKIYMARQLTGLLEEVPAFKHLDMEQYNDAESAAQLLMPQVFQDQIQDGELIRFIKENPRAIILFENIEQADNQFQLTLIDLITKDEADSGINCREIIFIFTSTLGSILYQSKEFLESFQKNKSRAKGLIMEAIARERKAVFDVVQEAIAPKLLIALSRNYIILFSKLSFGALERIGTESLAYLAGHFQAKSKITINYQNISSLIKLLILTQAPIVTVNKVRQKLPDEILFKITEFMRQDKTMPTTISFKVTKGAEEVLTRLLKEGDTLLARLFKKNETLELGWHQYRRGTTLFFSINRAEICHLPPSRELMRAERPTVTFSEVGFKNIAGNKHTKNILKQIIHTLNSPELMKKFQINTPKGMLIHGQPGVGKTMLSKAFAKEAGRPYIYVSRSDLFDPDYLRLVYLKAREFAPSIVLLDGIDVKGLIEGVFTGMPVDQLVMEIDALPLDPEESVFTVATAANIDEVPALLTEPDRIDIFVEAPELDREARRFFIEKILTKPNDGKIDVDRVVRYISGMSGYELQRIGKEAALYAIRHNLPCITEEILIEQINIIKYGSKLEKKHIHNLEEDLKMTAYHEAGHAVLSYLLLPEIKIEQVTIAPRLNTLGFISYSLDDFPGNLSKAEIFNNICVLMAGRAAGIKKFGAKGMDTGAASDLQQATHQVYTAIANLGMDEELGNVHSDTLSRNINHQLYSQIVEKRVSHWIKEATSHAEKLVAAHWQQIDLLATILIRQEIVDGNELESIMKKGSGNRGELKLSP
ncbi:MAG: AAA family ATPase [Desulfobulbaceae bacterium]|nr:AAA family ATPase [Desulfobulbaceae bacterium]HIJ78786.1 AAA family ATPase [Deltaproteobacteria bacterium]